MGRSRGPRCTRIGGGGRIRRMSGLPSSWTVFWAALATAACTGLGALPLRWWRAPGPRARARGNAVAAGLMTAASVSLVAEGQAKGRLGTVAGLALGTLGIALARRWLAGRQLDRLTRPGALLEVRPADLRRMVLIVGVMTLHSAAEGIGVGVAFGGGSAFGGFISASIALHNIPEGLAISLVLVPQGVGLWSAALWSVFSSLPQPLLAVPAYWFVETAQPLLPLGLGFAAGAMFWMTWAELLPEALADLEAGEVALVTGLSLVAMLALQALLGG